MRIEQFDYYLPDELIAQKPVYPRDSSRLMVLEKDTGGIEHKVFRDIVAYLHPGDVLVLNKTRVIPARLYGYREDTGGKIEIVLLKKLSDDKWESLVNPGKRARPGVRLVFGNGQLTAEVEDKKEYGGRVLSFDYNRNSFDEVLAELGSMPLPPYIKEQLDDPERYQTVFSQVKGSAAAPTAGLHFTPELIKKIEDKGITVVDLVLHVGLDTFRPIKTENVEDHTMHSEYYCIDEQSAQKINQAKAEGNKVIAVGTTVIRVLETVSNIEGRVSAQSGWTDIFIYPGYEFKCVDALLTNYHLPRSTLLLLVSAFAGWENISRAYETAVKKGYRFFSFGDAMLII